MREKIRNWEVLKALITSVIAALIIRVGRELAVARDVSFNLTDAQWTQVHAMSPTAAEAFLDAHSIPSPLLIRVEHAFYGDFWLEFSITAITVFIASTVLLAWAKGSHPSPQHPR